MGLTEDISVENMKKEEVELQISLNLEQMPMNASIESKNLLKDDKQQILENEAKNDEVKSIEEESVIIKNPSEAIVSEIISTESDFVDDLEICTEVFIFFIQSNL